MIENALNSQLKPGLWKIEWDGTVEHFEHIVECRLISNRKRLKTLKQVAGKLNGEYYNNWSLSRNMEAQATYIGPIENYPEYYL